VLFGLLTVLAVWILESRWDLPALAIALGGALVQRLRIDLAPLERALAGRLAPVLIGVTGALVVLLVWGSLREPPRYHDEAAYLFQARILASGRWVAPAPPLPEFFEQYHVFVTPVFAGKYPPGHPLMLVPGVWTGLPGLTPILWTGLAGGLLFALARRTSNVWVALLAWLLWTTAGGELRFRPAYFSQTTTTAAVLFAWWCLERWRRGKGARWLAGAGLALGWGFLTRPFTMIGFAIPVGIAVVRRIAARRRWIEVVPALAAAAGVLSVVPLWNHATTGDWRTSPYALYSRVYFPHQRPGFGAPVIASTRPLPADMVDYSSQFAVLHRQHRVSALGRILTRRAEALQRHLWNGWRLVLLPAAALGVFALSVEIVFALSSVALLLATYLVLAHSPDWTVYYMEAQPVLAFLTGLGLWRVLAVLAEKPGGERIAPSRRGGGAPAGMLLVTLLVAVLSVKEVLLARRVAQEAPALQRRFRTAAAAIPEPKAIVFVRYGPKHDVHQSLVENEPDLARARVWVVHDRGADNLRLIRAAPDRAPYRYEAASGRLTRLVEEP
jgi:hypothetical protein